MSDDKFTQEDADKIHDNVRRVLGISMPGKIELVDRIDDSGTIANCLPNIARNYYTIKLSNPDLRAPGPEEPDPYNDVFHEALHVILWPWCPNVKKLSRVEYEVYEGAVDRIAWSISRLYKGQ